MSLCRSGARHAQRTVVLAFAAVLGACRAENPPAPPPAEVIVETVARRDLPVILSYPARVAGSQVVEVRAQVNGRIIKRAYTEGARVNAGDLLFLIDPAPYKSAYDQAAAQVALQRSAAEQAQSELTRVDALVKEGAVSRREFDQTSAASSQARAALAAARAAERTARLNLDYTSVRAPVTGLTSKEAVPVGNLVNAGGGVGAGGDLLTSIVKADPAYVETSVPEPEYLRIKPCGETAREAGEDLRPRDDGGHAASIRSSAVVGTGFAAAPTQAQ